MFNRKRILTIPFISLLLILTYSLLYAATFGDIEGVNLYTKTESKYNTGSVETHEVSNPPPEVTNRAIDYGYLNAYAYSSAFNADDWVDENELRLYNSIWADVIFDDNASYTGYAYSEVSPGSGNVYFSINPGEGETIGQSAIVNYQFNNYSFLSFIDRVGTITVNDWTIWYGYSGGTWTQSVSVFNETIFNGQDYDGNIYLTNLDDYESGYFETTIGDYIKIDYGLSTYMEDIDSSSTFEGRTRGDINLFLTVEPITAVPIPGAVWLLGSGLIGIVGIRKKFKK